MGDSTGTKSPKAFGTDILSKFVVDAPTATFYHYTTQTGLLGIIRNREIWATHHPCLNDIQEFVHAKELLREELVRGSKSDPLLEAMQETLDEEGFDGVNLYVTSLSEDPDSLAQWRAYGGPSSGFALGLNTDGLVLPSPFIIARCIYDQAKQREIISTLVLDILNGLHNLPASIYKTPQFVKPYIDVFLRRGLHTLALIFEHPKFAEEREWRIVLTCLDLLSQSSLRISGLRRTR